MDDRKTREHIQAHADAVVRGDMDTVIADFSTIRYSGDSGELTLRTRWHDDAEHPVIVHIEPVN
jgi:hypothetical protein